MVEPDDVIARQVVRVNMIAGIDCAGRRSDDGAVFAHFFTDPDRADRNLVADVDIGVGDVIVPKAQKRVIKPLLAGFDAPEVLVYSLESTIAEKLDAILQRFELTGRMKDFFDIYYLSHTFDFKGHILLEAIAQTLTTRGTPYEPSSFDRIVALAEDADMRTKWRYFIRTMQSNDLALTDVIVGIDVFLHPIWDAMIGNTVFQRAWDANTMQWV